MAKKDKVLEHTSALQQNRTDPDMKVKPTLIIHRIICYIVLIFFSILCLFFFYILLVNASRSHYDIMSGFSFLPGSQFINNFQRIDTISKRFTHLTSQRVSDQSMDQYMVERAFSSLLITGEYHTDYPEENDVISGYQHICRIEIFQILRLIWPAQCGEWPQSRGEPGIQRILILFQMGTTTFWTFLRLSPGNHDLAAVFTVISRDPVAPP